jgi:ATP-dependent Clp protease ATP-binding subunit ClpC
MFERFTAYARHVVVLAQEEARRLNHNYIGTEHILLGLLGEPDGIAFRVLESFGLTLDGARQEVTEIIGLGKAEPGKHIPFTPRAKKTLELSLREALQLQHGYIGTEHILLGLIREGDGVAAQILQRHVDKLITIRNAVLDSVPPGKVKAAGRLRYWARRPGLGELIAAGPDAEPGQLSGQPALTATPAADATLSEAARLAGEQPVGSHHLLLAALADPDSAAARALATLGIDLDHAKSALRDMDVTGTSDEQPEVAGRRQMAVHVHEDKLTIVATDPVIVAAGRAALGALGEEASSSGVILGEDAVGASLGGVWQALRDSLETIRRSAASPETAA